VLGHHPIGRSAAEIAGDSALREAAEFVRGGMPHDGI